jgi:hypothetical protein
MLSSGLRKNAINISDNIFHNDYFKSFSSRLSPLVFAISYWAPQIFSEPKGCQNSDESNFLFSVFRIVLCILYCRYAKIGKIFCGFYKIPVNDDFIAIDDLFEILVECNEFTYKKLTSFLTRWYQIRPDIENALVENGLDIDGIRRSKLFSKKKLHVACLPLLLPRMNVPSTRSITE